MLTTGLVLAAVVMGAGMQRITGMGFALVAAPFLVLLLGPVEGVVLVNLCGAVTAGAIIFRVVRDIDWKRYAALAASALLGIIPAAILIRLVPPAVLEISIGVILAAGLTVLLVLKSATLPARRRYLFTAGGLSGFMNTAAGVGGPAVSIYSIATRWHHKSFAATMQPYFLTIGTFSLASKAVSAPNTFPVLPWTMWLAVAVACLAGLVLGDIAAKYVPTRAAQILLIVLAYLGAAATIVRGVLDSLT
ncbi:sulfite exporter TauE/SafE family protein [Arthrobacter sp. ISL-30]|uniref:sulfite exporter TauE/SafE family protein n=1 Tax=Arthrobacter sp. ISL-30 TaxID=2819109 RepID=UPI001BE9F0CF|nr:sulfite exporter TauE/SafE family protein [Arthrobacter sp. ISL-30]MBT2514594.1 sulfite exporter TauE/SafE family protein [Arthrobacter sp. ISL-30]